MNSKIKKIYHNYTLLEELGMWETPKGLQFNELLELAISLMMNTSDFGACMIRVVDEWQYSCEHNLSDSTINRRAWIGQAACFIGVGSPEIVTRAAWNRLTQQQMDKANIEADIAIAYWEKNYLKRKGERCLQKSLLELMS